MKYQVATRYGVEVGLYDTEEEALEKANEIDGAMITEMAEPTSAIPTEEGAS